MRNVNGKAPAGTPAWRDLRPEVREKYMAKLAAMEGQTFEVVCIRFNNEMQALVAEQRYKKAA